MVFFFGYEFFALASIMCSYSKKMQPLKIRLNLNSVVAMLCYVVSYQNPSGFIAEKKQSLAYNFKIL